MSRQVHDGLRRSLREVVLPHRPNIASQHSAIPSPNLPSPSTAQHLTVAQPPSTPKSIPTFGETVPIGSAASNPPAGCLADPTITLDTESGEHFAITQQVQLYAPNNLLRHPLVSPALSYLGGLPPLMFIASDREVLRDEIIYACVAHTL